LILSVKTNTSYEVNTFFNKTKNRLSFLPAKSIDLNSDIKIYYRNNFYLLVYRYDLMGEEIMRIAGFIGSVIILFFLGVSWWLFCPLVFFFIQELSSLFCYLLILKGLRKANYKGKVTMIHNFNCLKEVVFNVTK